MANEFLGWVSGGILAVTLGQQLWGQWRDRSVLRGPPLLIGGHLLATGGLVVYSVLQRNRVFAVVSACLFLAILGSLWVGKRNRLRRRRRIPTRRSDVIPFRPRHLLLQRDGSNR